MPRNSRLARNAGPTPPSGRCERLGLLLVLGLAIADPAGPEHAISAGGLLLAALLYERMTEPVRHLHRLVDESHERWLPAKDFLDLLKVCCWAGRLPAGLPAF